MMPHYFLDGCLDQPPLGPLIIAVLALGAFLIASTPASAHTLAPTQNAPITLDGS